MTWPAGGGWESNRAAVAGSPETGAVPTWSEGRDDY